MLIPSEFRTPVHYKVCLAMAAACAASGDLAFAAILMIVFHCMLRLAEALNLKWCDIRIFIAEDLQRYPGIFGVVAVRETEKPPHGRAREGPARSHRVRRLGELA